MLIIKNNMKYKNRDKVRIVRCLNGQDIYLNTTGEIIGELGWLSLVRLNYDDKILIMFNEQLIKIEKGLEIE